MLEQTKTLKYDILTKFDDSYDRVRHMKDYYKGETAYILGTGPSIDKISSFEKLNDKLVISMKQSLRYVSTADFHLLNFCNLTRYNYENNNTIVGWTIWDQHQPNTILQNFSCDFILPTYKLNDGRADLDNSIAFNLDKLDLLDMNKELSRPWGPGTMYELAIPLALYLGCKKIVTIGWDLFASELNKFSNDTESLYQPHCYNDNDLQFIETNTKINKKEILGVINSTKHLYEWLDKRGIELEIVDPLGNNPAYKQFKRITL